MLQNTRAEIRTTRLEMSQQTGIAAADKRLAGLSNLLGLLARYGTLTEPILKTAGNSLQMAHTTSPISATAESFVRPANWHI